MNSQLPGLHTNICYALHQSGLDVVSESANMTPGWWVTKHWNLDEYGIHPTIVPQMTLRPQDTLWSMQVYRNSIDEGSILGIGPHQTKRTTSIREVTQGGVRLWETVHVPVWQSMMLAHHIQEVLHLVGRICRPLPLTPHCYWLKPTQWHLSGCYTRHNWLPAVSCTFVICTLFICIWQDIHELILGAKNFKKKILN